ncbi:MULTISPECIES: hypothetical protein [unclassified Pseudofrankia]|uniref:hypothetical protein n=1 Tax=unclassified Pseudofrankia TaxID=2994372 RepID=UPI0018E2A9A3|nr:MULTISPECIES: hypothetical protein [unclassified Pseudofrankia]MDT3438388.1 hypothetical protein [Pseudofrankia sp. BMG5.37]
MIARPDGVTLRLQSYDRKYSVPHDLAHFVAEREFRMAQGFWGSVASGVVFASMRVVAGRPRHDAARRSRAILAANQRHIMLAEVVAGAVHRALDDGDQSAPAALTAAWGTIGTGAPPFDPARGAAAVGRLRELRDQWQTLPPGGELALAWDVPVKPAATVPQARRRGDTARRGGGRR